MSDPKAPSSDPGHPIMVTEEDCRMLERKWKEIVDEIVINALVKVAEEEKR